MRSDEPTPDTELPAPEGSPPHAEGPPPPAPSAEETDVHPVERPHLPTGKVPLGRLALEAAMIAFGVLLALSLESYVEHRKLQRQAHEALTHIRAEVTRNADIIRGQVPVQTQVADSLRVFQECVEALRQSRRAGGEPSVPRVSLSPSILSTASWQAAMSTGTLAHVDFRTVQALSRYYEAMQWLRRIEDGYLGLVARPVGDRMEDRAQWAHSLELLMRGYIEIEQALANAAETLAPKLPAE